MIPLFVLGAPLSAAITVSRAPQASECPDADHIATQVERILGRPLATPGNAPAFVAEQAPGVARNMVLLTRPYPAQSVGRKGSRLYLCPTEPVPINRWDYTSADRVDATVCLGRLDADRHGVEITRLLSH